jgi:hypothetical protein
MTLTTPGSTNILCTSYNIERVDKTTFGCRSNFSVDACSKSVVVALEAWTVTGRLLQPSSKPIFVDCDVVAEVDGVTSDAIKSMESLRGVLSDDGDPNDERATEQDDAKEVKSQCHVFQSTDIWSTDIWSTDIWLIDIWSTDI